MCELVFRVAPQDFARVRCRVHPCPSLSPRSPRSQQLTRPPGTRAGGKTQDDIVNLKVNKLTSTKTQLPYEYYSLPYCRPDPIVNSAENLGEVLRGDRIENSLYQIEIRLDEQCKVICKIDSLSASQAKSFQSKIDDEYRVNMILDNLPVAMVKMREDNGKPFKTYERGFPVGFKAAIEEGGEEKFFLHNHLRFTILYHKDIETDLARIVGFETEPFSVKHEYEPPWDSVKPLLDTCSPGRMQYVTHGLAPQMVAEGEEVIFSYDVIFKMSSCTYSRRLRWRTPRLWRTRSQGRRRTRASARFRKCRIHTKARTRGTPTCLQSCTAGVCPTSRTWWCSLTPTRRSSGIYQTSSNGLCTTEC